MTSDNAGKVLYTLMSLVAKLKGVPRDGWNRGARQVASAESVADHSYGTMMLAMVFPHLVSGMDLDHLALMSICGVHDLVEAKTGDINIYVARNPAERARLREEKAHLEKTAIREMRAELGDDIGWFIFDLWVRFEKSDSVEAKIARELDKIEVAFQALWYFQQGHQIDPWEFFQTARQAVSTPELVQFLDREILPKLPKRGGGK